MGDQDFFIPNEGTLDQTDIQSYGVINTRPRKRLKIGSRDTEERFAPNVNELEFKVAIICALPLEAEVFQALFEKKHDAADYPNSLGDDNVYSIGVIGRHNVVIVHLPGMGKAYAAAAASNIRKTWSGIQLALVAGICGGAPRVGDLGVGVKLGDVIISEGIVQYDLGRRYPGNKFESKDGLLDSLPRPPPRIRAFLAKLKSQQKAFQSAVVDYLETFQNEVKSFEKYPGLAEDKLYESSYRHMHHAPTDCTQCCEETGVICEDAMGASCKRLGCDETHLQDRSTESWPPLCQIHFGIFASGDTVMKSGEDRDHLSKQYGVIGFEMEGAGVWETLPSLVIKGVCDYADSHKSKSWQRHAACTAGAATKYLLDQWVVEAPVRKPSRRLTEQDIGSALLKDLPYVFGATYDSNHDKEMHGCHPNTRKRLLKDIFAWGRNQQSRSIFWLNGMAGTGKSTIAMTVAEQFASWDMLAGSFFFSRGAGDLSSTKYLFPTLAHQIARVIPGYQSIVSKTLANNPDVCNRSLNTQWNLLIHGPLSQVSREAGQGPGNCYVIVIDALDECEDQDMDVLLKIFSRLKDITGLSFRIFATSRPESLVQSGFDDLPSKLKEVFTLHHVETEIISADIKTFLKSELDRIRRRRKFPKTWATDEDIDTLVRQADGLFIYAATICRWVDAGKLLAQSRLRSLLKGTSTSQAKAVQSLDQLYTQILASAYFELAGAEELDEAESTELIQQFQTVVGAIVTLRDQLDPESLVRLLDSDPPAPVETIIQHLSSIINTDNFGNIRVLHPSFREFLINSNRCGDRRFFIDQNQLNQRMAMNCIVLLESRLKKYITGITAKAFSGRETFTTLEERREIREALLKLYTKQDPKSGQEPNVPATSPETYYFQDLTWWQIDEDYDRVFASPTLKPEMPENLQQIDFLPEIGYACRYWGRHLQDCAVDPGLQAELQDHGLAHNLLKTHFLHWLEVMTVMGTELDASGMLDTLRSLVESQKNRPKEFLDFIEHAKRFISDFYPIFVEDPSELYNSCLLFCPEPSLIKKYNPFDSRTWIFYMTSVQEIRDSSFATLAPAKAGRFITSIAHMKFSIDGAIFITHQPMNEAIEVWDTATGTVKQVIFTSQGGVDMLASFMFNGLLLVTDFSGSIELWNFDTQTYRKLDYHEMGSSKKFTPDWAYTISLDRRLIAFCHGESTALNIFDVETEVFHKIEDIDTKYEKLGPWHSWGSGGIGNFLFSPGNDLLAWLPPQPNKIAILDIGTQKTKVITVPKTGNGTRTEDGVRIDNLVFSPDNSLLALCWDHHIFVLELISGEVISEFDNDAVETSGSGFDPRLASTVWSYKDDPRSINFLAFSADSKLLIVSFDSGAAINIWDIRTTSLRKSFTFVVWPTRFGDVDFLASVSVIMYESRETGQSNRGSICVWSTDSGSDICELQHSQELLSEAELSHDQRLSPDQTILAVFLGWKGICLWDITDGKLQDVLFPTAPIDCDNVEFSPDSKVLLADTEDHHVKLWRLGKQNKEISDFEKFRFSPIELIALSSDGSLVATCTVRPSSPDKPYYIDIWAIQPEGLDRERILMKIECPKEVISSFKRLSFSNDNDLLIACTDRHAVMWSINTEEGSARDLRMIDCFELGCSIESDSEIDKVHVSPDTKTLLVTFKGSRIFQLWDTSTEALICQCGTNDPLEQEDVDAESLPPDAVRHWVSLSPDGQLVASRGPLGGDISIWNASTGILEACFQHQTTFRYHYEDELLEFSPDNQLLAVSGYEYPRDRDTDGLFIEFWDLKERRSLGIARTWANTLLSWSFTNDNMMIFSTPSAIRWLDISELREPGKDTDTNSVELVHSKSSPENTAGFDLRKLRTASPLFLPPGLGLICSDANDTGMVLGLSPGRFILIKY